MTFLALNSSIGMRQVTSCLLDAYCREDRIARLLIEESQPGDDLLAVQRWLRATPAKRLIYQMIYGDLLDRRGLRVLDVGGALSSLTRRLAAFHRYELIDLMAHDAPQCVASFRASLPRLSLRLADWWNCVLDGSYDLIIANDLFPNVDQRLELFLERMLPLAGEIRLSLTYYNRPRFYMTRRVDGDEMLCILAWSGRQTAEALTPYAERIVFPDFAQFTDSDAPSLFANGRQVSIVALRGDRAQ
jgi:hypothetical protein